MWQSEVSVRSKVNLALGPRFAQTHLQTKPNLVLPDILCSYHGYHFTLLRVCQLIVIKQHTGHGEKAEVWYGHRYLTEWSEMVNGQKKESENWNAVL